MFLKNLLVSRDILLKLPKAYFARKVVSPRVVRVLDKDGNDLTNAKLPQVSNFADEKYDDTFAFDDQLENALPVNLEIRKSKASMEIPRYDKASDKKNEFRAMMTNLSLKKRRESMNLIVLEGKRLINDAIDAGIKLKCIYFTLEENLKDIKNLPEIISQNDTRLTKVLYKDMKIFSSLVTSPGIMAVSEKPDYNKLSAIQKYAHKMPLILVCDSVRDPGNLGTIIRTAAAAGVDKVLLSSGCVDGWNSKVIKSAAGAHFHIPLQVNVAWSELTNHLPDQFDLYIADSKHDIATSSNNIKTFNYFDVQFFAQNSNNHKVLIIGNEAFGPSSESYQLARQCSGCRVQIPLYRNVDSLNSAIASSILLFEIRKQFETKLN